MLKITPLFAAVSGFVGVALGAGAAHVLRARLDEQAMTWLETGIRYQLIHTAALVGLAALMAFRPVPALNVTAGAWIAGILLFSGALYLLAFTGVRGFAHMAPVGGLALLAGWAALAWAAVQIARG